MLGADDASASSPAVPTTMPTDDPMFTIIVGQGDGDGVDGGTVFQLPASTFAAFPDTLLHDRTHRILQFRDPHLIRLPDCSPAVFRRVVLPFYDTAESEWHVPVHLAFPKNGLLSAGTFLGRLVEAVFVGEPSGNKDGDDNEDSEADELAPHRINHDLQFLGIPSPFDPRWSLSVFAWTATGRAALRRMQSALAQIEQVQKEAAEATKSWVSTINELNAIWPQQVTAGIAESVTHSPPRDQERQSDHPEPTEQEEISSSESPQQVIERDSTEQSLSAFLCEDDEECSDHEDRSKYSSTSSDMSSTPKPVVLIASAELQETMNSFFRVGELAKAAEEVMEKWLVDHFDNVRRREIHQFAFEPQACPAADVVIENKAISETLTVLDNLFGLQNVYFRRMDLADVSATHSRSCWYNDGDRDCRDLVAVNPKLGDDFQHLPKPETIIFGDVSTLPQQDASTAVYHPIVLQRVPRQVFQFDFEVNAANRQELPSIAWPSRDGLCWGLSKCDFYATYLSTICVVIYPFMG